MMLVFGCGLGWVAFERTQNAKSQADLAAIRKFGGSVEFYESKPDRATWLQWLLGDDSFRNVSEVTLQYSRMTDAGLEHLKALTQRQSLSRVTANFQVGRVTG